MQTVRALASSADRSQIWARFPTKTLAITLAFVIAAIAVFALVDGVVPPLAPAKAASENAAPEKAAPKAPRKDLLRSDGQPFGAGALIAVGGVIAGAVAVMLFLKRVLKGSRHVPSDKKLLKVRDVLAMGPKRAIYLIGLEHRNLVIGVSGDQLSLLSEYSAEQEDEAPARAAAPAREGRAAELALARSAASAESPRPPSILDIEIGDEVAVPPSEPAPIEQKPAAAPRVFSFAAVNAEKNQPPRQQSERVPHKFRQLLQQAAEAEGAKR